MDIGNRIRKLRKQASPKITIQQLADMVGITREYLSDIERGEGTPSLGTLESICNALGVTLPEFFAVETEQLDPSLSRLLQAARKLNDEECEQLAQLINTLKKDS